MDVPPSNQPSFAEVLVRDPLTPVTRKERLYLLAVSLIGIAMVRTGLVPSKIATFGIELNRPNRSSLLFLLALISIYFLAAFVIYAASDFMTRRENLRTASYAISETGVAYPMLLLPVAWTRLVFEFVLPVIVALYAIHALLERANRALSIPLGIPLWMLLVVASILLIAIVVVLYLVRYRRLRNY